MSNQNTPEVYPKWTTICARATLWKERPRSDSWKSFLSIGASDSGRLEYNGNSLRFTGRKSRIEIPAIGELTEIRLRFRLTYLLLWFALFAVFGFAVLYCLHLSFYWVRWDEFMAFFVLGLALLMTILYWLYFRLYARWVCISFSTLDGQPREACFTTPPISGGSQKLYRDLSHLRTPQSNRR
jgi:hypothetical protein